MTDLATAVVGVGRLGREHARLLGDLSGSRLVGVHDADPATGERVARELDTRHFGDPAALLEKAEAVVVAVPTAEHHSVARQALDADCHVLVEKPFTATIEEADDLIRTAEGRNLDLRVGHVERFNGAVRAARPHLDRPRFIESMRLAPFQSRGTDVTVVLDLMIHDIDLVLGLVDASISSLHAVGTAVLTDSVDIANARLLFEDGTVAEITASRVSEEQTRTLRLFQASGYLRLDLARGQGEFLRRRDSRLEEAPTPEAGPVSLEDVVERVPLSGDRQEPLRLELEEFLGAVRGESSRAVSAREGKAALEIAREIGQQIDRFADRAVEAD